MEITDTAQSEVFERLARIISRSLHIDVSQVTPDAYLDDLGAESLDLIEISMETEAEFNIWISDKSILQTSDDVFGEGVLQQDGVLTEAGKALLRSRMSGIDSKFLEGEVATKDLNHLFLKVSTWVAMIQGLMEYTPKTCPGCGASLAASVAFRMKCGQCGVETPLLSGEELNKRWVREYYEKEYLPSRDAAQTPAVQSQRVVQAG